MDPRTQGGLVLESVNPVTLESPASGHRLRHVSGTMGITGSGQQRLMIQAADAEPSEANEDATSLWAEGVPDAPGGPSVCPAPPRRDAVGGPRACSLVSLVSRRHQFPGHLVYSSGSHPHPRAARSVAPGTLVRLTRLASAADRVAVLAPCQLSHQEVPAAGGCARMADTFPGVRHGTMS